MDKSDFVDFPWRTGRTVGRTIYAQGGPRPTPNDPLIGTMDTPELATEVVRTHNQRLTIERMWEESWTSDQIHSKERE
jgi:hypothetical protein